MIHQYNSAGPGSYDIPPDSPVYLFPEGVGNFPGDYPHVSPGADPRFLGRIVNNNHHHHSSPHKMWYRVPRVLPDQKTRFETEDIFKRNATKSEVRYTPFRERPADERRAKFQTGCREGHTEIAILSTGLGVLLTWNPHHMAVYGCDFVKEPGKVHICAPLILNGVCVRWRGWVDLEKLDGVGCLEFDEESARRENETMQKQVQMYNRKA